MMEQISISNKDQNQKMEISIKNNYSISQATKTKEKMLHLIIKKIPQQLIIKKMINLTSYLLKMYLMIKKKQELNKIKDEDDWGISNDDWGDLDTAPKEINLNKEDLKNKNLNKLSDAELAAHKRAMDKDFSKNQLKPGDQGFVYDKVVDFSKKG